MSSDQVQVIPRLEDESNRAHAAKSIYVSMGPDRSLEKLRQQIGNRSVRYLEEWSSRFDWAATARAWDDQQAAAIAQDAADTYRADLAEYRQRYQKAGKDLYTVAQGMLGLLANNLRGQRIEGKDGKIYTIPAVEMNASTLGQVKAAFQTAADLEALALRVEDLLGKLSNAEPGTE